MKRLIFVVLGIGLLMACSGGGTETMRRLQQAEGVVEKRPDSAAAVLSLLTTTGMTEEEMALYGLLKTTVAYKTHGTIENDSLISSSITYYNRHGDDKHRGRAYFYRGAIRYRFDNYLGAVSDFKKAETLSEEADDEKLKNRNYIMLYRVNRYFNNLPQSLKYAHKLLDSDIKLNDSIMILRSLLECAIVHADMGQTDSACTYIGKALQLKKKAAPHLLAYIYATAATIYQDYGDTEKAVAYLKKWEETDSDNYIGYLSEARIRKAQGKYEKAIKLAKMEMGLPHCDRKERMKCMQLLAEIYELTGDKHLALSARRQVEAYEDSMRYVNQAIQMVEWQQKYDEERQSKEYYRRTSWMLGLIILLAVVVTLSIAVGTWWHRRKVRRLSFQLDEDARRINELRTKIELQEKSGEENGLEMARLKEELQSRMERISGTLLVGTQMFSRLQQRQCIAEATAKEQQCLVDYYAQLRPKRWQEWERKYKGLSTAQYIFLIMQDDLHFDDASIAAALNVKRTSVRSMRSRIKGREK